MDDNKYDVLKDFITSFELEDYADIVIPKGIVAIANKAWNYRQNIKVENYLEGFYLSIEDNRLTEEELGHLQKFIGSKRNQDIFLEILESALKSLTVTTSQLLGYYAGKIITNDLKMSYDDEIVIYALSNLNDWDLEVLKKVNKHFNNFSNKRSGATATSIHLGVSMDDLDVLSQNNEISDYEILHNKNLKRLKASLNKLKSLQLLDEGGLYIYTDATSFLVSDLGRMVIKNLDKIESVR